VRAFFTQTTQLEKAVKLVSKLEEEGIAYPQTSTGPILMKIKDSLEEIHT